MEPHCLNKSSLFLLKSAVAGTWSPNISKPCTTTRAAGQLLCIWYYQNLWQKILPVSGFQPTTSQSSKVEGRKVVFMHHAPCMVATDHWERIEELVVVGIAIALFPNPKWGPQCMYIHQSNRPSVWLTCSRNGDLEMWTSNSFDYFPFWLCLKHLGYCSSPLRALVRKQQMDLNFSSLSCCFLQKYKTSHFCVAINLPADAIN